MKIKLNESLDGIKVGDTLSYSELDDGYEEVFRVAGIIDGKWYVLSPESEAAGDHVYYNNTPDQTRDIDTSDITTQQYNLSLPDNEYLVVPYDYLKMFYTKK